MPTVSTSFPPLSSESPSHKTMLNALSGEAASPYFYEIRAWKSYLFYFQLFNNCIRDVGFIIGRLLLRNHSLYIKIHDVLKTIHDVLMSIDQTFLKGIQMMKEGHAPSFSFEPAHIPNWPPSTTTSHPSIFSKTWQLLKPVLTIIAEKTPSNIPLEAELAGLIEIGDTCVKELNDVFGEQ